MTRSTTPVMLTDMPAVILLPDEFAEDALPPYCIVCGTATNEYPPVPKRFQWRFTRRVWTPLCEDHRSYWQLRRWVDAFWVATLLGYIATFRWFLGPRHDEFTLYSSLVIYSAVAIAYVIFKQTSVRCYRGDPHSLELHNVHQRFKDELLEQRQSSKDRIINCRG